MSNSPSKGLLAVWMNMDPAWQPDFDAWYTQQHLPERVGIPGFLNGCRYEAISGKPRFLAVYDTESADVLASPAYRERLEHPTEWTQRVMPRFKDTVRVTASILSEKGRGTGGFLRTLRIEPAQGRYSAVRVALSGPLAEQLCSRPGVARVRIAETASTGQSANTAETAMRGQDKSASFVVLIDGTDAAAIQAACTNLLSAAHLTAIGADTPVHTGVYRLLYFLSH